MLLISKPSPRSVIRYLSMCGILICSLTLTGCSLFQTEVESTPSPKICKLLVNTAYCQIGKRYKSGGATPKGFDCSGLVYYVYQKNGYKIPRMSTDQAKFGRRVGKDQLRAGDILIFRMGDSPRGLHTAIYTGDRCFIHSPSSGKKVKQDTVEKKYWQERLIGVRRIVK